MSVKDRDFVNTVNIFYTARTMTSLKYYTMTMATATTTSRKGAAEDEEKKERRREREAPYCTPTPTIIAPLTNSPHILSRRPKNGL